MATVFQPLTPALAVKNVEAESGGGKRKGGKRRGKRRGGGRSDNS